MQALTNRKQYCTKNYIFFFQMFFPVLSGKVIFLFPENVILFFRGKMKDDLSQKNTWKYDIFFNCSKKMVFPKKSHWHMIFLVSSGKIHFFFTKIWYFFCRRKMKDDLSQKIHGNMMFSVYYVKVVFFFLTNMKLSFRQKTKRWPSPGKYT